MSQLIDKGRVTQAPSQVLALNQNKFIRLEELNNTPTEVLHSIVKDSGVAYEIKGIIGKIIQQRQKYPMKIVDVYCDDIIIGNYTELNSKL